MTLASPTLVTFEPKTRDRNPVRTPKADVAQERQPFPGSLSGRLARIPAKVLADARPTQIADRERHARAQVQARWAVLVGSIAIRVVLAVALALAAWSIVFGGGIASATDAFASWYTTTIAPLAAIDLTVTPLEPAVSPAVEMGILPGTPEALRPVG